MLLWLFATYLFGAIFPRKVILSTSAYSPRTTVSSYVTCKRDDDEYFRCYDGQQGEAYCCDPNRDGSEQCCYENNTSAVLIVMAICIPVVVFFVACFCCSCKRDNNQESTERSPRQQRPPAQTQQRPPAQTQHVQTIEEPKLEDAPPAYENVIANDMSLEQSSFQPESPIAENSFSMPPPYFSTHESNRSPPSGTDINIATEFDISVSSNSANM